MCYGTVPLSGSLLRPEDREWAEIMKASSDVNGIDLSKDNRFADIYARYLSHRFHRFGKNVVLLGESRDSGVLENLFVMLGGIKPIRFIKKGKETFFPLRFYGKPRKTEIVCFVRSLTDEDILRIKEDAKKIEHKVVFVRISILTINNLCTSINFDTGTGVKINVIGLFGQGSVLSKA